MSSPLDATTPLDIIRLALKNAGILGVGQDATAEDASDAFVILNMMLSQWNRKRWLIWHLVTTSVVSTGAQSYSIGLGQDLNVARPDRLEAAFFRQLTSTNPNQIDYPLEILESREDYNQIALKQLQSFPNYIWYDASYPVGYVYPWPIPQASMYSVHVTTKAVLPKFTSLNETIVLPDEYYAAILYNLSARLRPAYQLPPDIQLVALAKDSLAVIRGANTQIPRLTMPGDLVRPGIYNPYSDQIR